MLFGIYPKLLKIYVHINPGRDVDHGGVYACVRAGVHGKSLCMPLNFAVNLTMLLKN